MRIPVLLMGQFPPPYGGLSLINKSITEHSFNNVIFYCIKLNVGKTHESKIQSLGLKSFNLIYAIVKAIYYKFKFKISILYYAPSGPKAETVIRDIILLSVLRIFFNKVVFHFHSAGLSLYLQNKSSIFRNIALRAYKFPDYAIQTSSLNPNDGKYIKSKKVVIIPNGIKDEFTNYKFTRHKDVERCHILFVGLLCESKGVMILLQALNKVKEDRKNIKCHFIGEFSSEYFKQRVLKFCIENSLESIVEFAGVKIGHEKWKYFEKADIFCFPTFFEHESFGIVLLEAMMFGIPIISTLWRGIPEVVKENQQGFLIPINDAESLHAKLDILIRDPSLRNEMGENGRKLFIEKFISEIFFNKLERVFIDLQNT